MKKLITKTKILYLASLLVILLLFMSIRGCHGKSYGVIKAKNDSINKLDSIILINASIDNLNADSINAIITKNKAKRVITDDSAASSYDWFIMRGYQVPLSTYVYLPNIYSYPQAVHLSMILLLISIDLVFILQLIGLTLFFIKRFRKLKLIMILSSVNLFLILYSIFISFIFLNNHYVKIDYGFWIFLFVIAITSLSNILVFKKNKEIIRKSQENIPVS